MSCGCRLRNWPSSTNFFLASGYEATKSLLALDEPPDAIFAAGDEMAIGAIHAISDAGLSAPDDIAIVGFDDIESASLIRPALTTVAQSPRDLCASAVEALMDIIGQTDDELSTSPPHPRILPTNLVVRASCGAR